MRKAIIFVDWDMARRLGPRHVTLPNDVKRQVRQTEDVVAQLKQLVANHLTSIDPNSIFRVRWRIYHGWYSGLTKTNDLKVIEKFQAGMKSTTIGKVSFGSDLVPATSLLCEGPRKDLFDTLRAAVEGPGTRQKMVDTGLVGDLLQSARSDHEDIHLVIGDDDDLLPGLFIAEKWGVKVHMLRQQPGSAHLRTAGLVSLVARAGAA